MDKMRIVFRHLIRLTDDTGLLEHAAYLVPRRKEGYTTDDNARALWLVSAWSDVLPESPLAARLSALSDTYLAFLAWAQEEDGHFHNDFLYTREKEARPPSDDTQGRALYALAYAARRLPRRWQRAHAEDLFRRGLTVLPKLSASRGLAYALAAAAERLEDHLTRDARTEDPIRGHAHGRAPERADEQEKDRERDVLQAFLRRGTDILVERFHSASDGRWRWFEPTLTYANAVIPWGLMKAARALGDRKVQRVAKEALDFLLGMTFYGRSPIIRPVGNRGWGDRRKIAEWDAQPLDVFKLALAAYEAGLLMNDRRYFDVVRAAHGWFYGQNALGVMMVDVEEGAAYDGLTPDGPNENAGAEALLSFLHTERIVYQTALRMSRVPHEEWMIRADGETLVIERRAAARAVQ
ncbi:MAG: glycosyl transferase [Hydrogenibacillus sp.]|nr:glycosyl transferase [Hydrogenibacillus sp.]